MGQIKFNKEMINKAEYIIAFRDNKEAADAYFEIREIRRILNQCTSGLYDYEYVSELDNELRHKYGTINELECFGRRYDRKEFYNYNEKDYNDILRRLQLDKFGIMYQLLKSRKIVFNIEDFVENVVVTDESVCCV